MRITAQKAHRTFKVKHCGKKKKNKTRTQTHNREVQQDGRVVKAFISWLKEKDPPDIPEGTDQSQPDWFKLFVLGSTSITIRWSSVSDYSTGRKGALSIRAWRNRFTPLDL